MAHEKPPFSKVILFYDINDQDAEKKVIQDFITTGVCGPVDNISFIKDKITGKPKGFAFIKFTSMVSAFSAVCLNNRTIRKVSDPRTYKIKFCKSRNSGTTENYLDNPFYYFRCVFARIPENFSEDDVRYQFSIFGEIAKIKLLQNKVTNKRYGCVITYRTTMDAVAVVENGYGVFSKLRYPPVN